MSHVLLQHARQTQTSVHHHIHAGVTFSTFWMNEDASPIADNNLFGIALQTGDKEAHLTFGVAGGGNTEATLIENPILSTTGTLLDIYNLKRNSGNGSSMTAWHSPTVSTGTYLMRYLLPGGWTNQTPGGMTREDTEWILQPNTFYVLAGINRAGSNQPGSISSQWYEED